MCTCTKCLKKFPDRVGFAQVRNIETGIVHWLCIGCREEVRRYDRITDGPEHRSYMDRRAIVRNTGMLDARANAILTRDA